VSDNDVKMNRLVAPASGRQGTSTALSTAAVAVEIKNLDDAPINNFTVKYRINNGAWVFENVAATITAGGVFTHTFTGTEDFSGTGTYTITAVVQHAGDAATRNDTGCVCHQAFKQCGNQPGNTFYRWHGNRCHSYV
jgi:hypothetical protein